MNIKNIERKIADFNENLTMFDQHFIIIPYLPSGYVDYGETGQIDRQRYIDNYLTYKRIWTGNDSFIVTWKDSFVYNSTEPWGDIEGKFQIGDFLAGWLEQNASNVDIDTDVSYSEYKAQTTEKTLTFRINANEFNMDTNYEFMFYKVPEIYSNILFRVESLEREYMGKDLMCYVLTLKSLNQELSNTGRARQQNVMPNAPGQGYWDAQIIDQKPPNNQLYKEFYGRYIIPNTTKQYNLPVKKVVFKAFGMCALSNIAFWGRATARGNGIENFGIQGWIFPINFTNASTYTLHRTQNAQSNYYWIRNLAPFIQFDEDMMEGLKNIFSTIHIWPTQGFAEINGGNSKGVKEMTDTNIKDGDDNFSQQLYGKVQAEPDPNGKNKLVYYPWKLVVPEQEYATDTIYGCAQKYKFGSKTGVTGVEYAIHDLMFHAFWKQKKMKVLPVGKQNTLDFGYTLSSSISMLKDGLFYSAAAMMGIGIGATLIQKILKPTFDGFSCLVPASLMDFMVNECSNIF